MAKRRQAIAALQALGVSRGLAVIYRAATGRRPAIAAQVWAATEGRRLLELGGPSVIFRTDNLLSVYGRATSIDNVNYAAATLWESDLKDGGDYSPEGKPLGVQMLREATDLGDIGTYDTILSSHLIEHVANPLRALHEWLRVCAEGGALVLVLPHRGATFDHRRPLTTLDHMTSDEHARRGEDDTTHVEEVLQRHDLSRDEGVSSMDELAQRLANNEQTRAMHHHVYNVRTAVEMVAHVGWSVEAAEFTWPHIVIVARKSAGSGPGTIRSPFPEDRARR
ncbi:SAM-dependent methyltransferase [Marmoricola sp. URHA0025 HA25]